MVEPRRVPSRRDLLIASGACGLAATSASIAALAQVPKPADAAAVEASPSWQAAIKSVIGDAKVVEGRITMTVPEIAENGNVVPFDIAVDSPMTDTSFVRTLRLYSTGNPQALLVTFRFSRDSGKPAVSSRIRLAKSQDIVALAELNDGTFLTATRNIKVTIGGCGG